MSTILLVEDDPDIRHLVSYKLTKGGFDVTAVADGLAALRAVRENPPDLVLLDVRMPEMSGIEVCRELRAGPLGAAVPIIMLTARARPQDLEQGFAAGATEYIIKPFSPRDLQDRVEAALGRVSR
ncbi:response regulator [Actinoplanes sp. ATCC 53533]|uniref:response regulator transcription factor n=1 Tax=Actinoplanes sp. ATCC 53533 TaxID=1288362 RepID=UPI000F7A5FF9|nr:response regulator [Actinoplanes sp. ATCC 53533]RSM72260.1 response regulator [Actinoplanes sp. ATCC 53533]